MNKRKVATIVSFFCIMIAIIICVLLFQSPTFNPGRIYYNDNLLYKEIDNIHAKNWKSNKTQDDKVIEFSIGDFSGMRTVHKFEVTENQNLSISYSWNVTVEKGNFKIVLIDISNSKVEVLCEGSGNGSISNLSLQSGKYRIKFVGDKTAVNGEFTLF